MRCLLVLVLCLLPALATPNGEPQLRAIWVDGFNEGIKTPEQIDTLLARVRQAGLNAVVVQVRKSADAYYHSHYEPRASDIAEGFDPLAYLIQKAHGENPPIQVHTWLNTCAVGRNPNPRAMHRRYPEYLALSDMGEDFDGEATKIDPGHPGAADWTFRIYLDVIRHYDVDGIHFDFVRYGGERWGYNPVSVQRYNERRGRPDGFPFFKSERFKQWRRDQVTALVRKTYLYAMTVNPKVMVSAATITWGNGPEQDEAWTRSAAYSRVYQDWRGWMEEGILDWNIPMCYFNEARHGRWLDNWMRFVKDHQYTHYAAVGLGNFLNPIEDTLKQLERVWQPTARGNKARGVCFYSYATTNTGADGKEQKHNPAFYEALGKVFREWVPVPPAPWKENPVNGHVKGTILYADSLNPAEHTLVTLHGRGIEREQYVDGTGFFGFPHLPPGEYRLTIAPRNGSPLSMKVRVERGRVTTRNLLLGDTDAQRVKNLSVLARLPEGTTVLVEEQAVTVGMPGTTGDFQLGEVVVRVPGELPLPFLKGDVVTVKGTLRREAGRVVIDGAKAVLVDMLPKGRAGS
ncbi:MAG: family 10 glycosylhydrolase [Armatimonadetes bacterium]|nr:family 10 glycosylhydrolase [Armatimonadota bacterium]